MQFNLRICTGVLSWLLSTSAWSAQWNVPDEHLITVTGQGEANAQPDQAVVQLGVEGEAADAQEAQSIVNENMQRVIQEVKRLGIPENAIQTTGLNLSPVYAPHQPGREAEAPEISGYRAQNTIQIEVNDLKLTGQVIDTAIKAGANRLEGVSFELKDDLPQRTAALKEAVQEAKAKAEAIAASLGLQLGAIYNVNEGGVTVAGPRPMFAAQRAMAAETAVQPGEIRVQANVTAQYRIDPFEKARERRRPPPISPRVPLQRQE